MRDLNAETRLIDLTVSDLQQLIATEVERVAGDRPPVKFLDTSGVCQMLGISPPTLRKLIEEGLPCVRIGELKRFDPDAVRAWLNARAS